MTITPRKTNSHKKARVVSSGFLELINTFVLTPRQGIAGKQTSFRSMVKHHRSDSSTPVSEIVPTQVCKSTSVCFRGSEVFQIAKNGGPHNEHQ